ncbi:MAG: hypothetical protein GY704_09935, partial [Phycisphaeraceae bacterium]|nr:hypothetical protein [Phycisphaeraceae bacterium]
VEEVAEALQRRVIRYDKGGDRHYDVISAFIKSVRGSDVDGALYWLHTMIAAGEDPRFIARRIVILASEDIGLADSAALGIAVDAFRAVEFVGLPEAAFALSHATIYLTLAPKSNSVKEAIGRAAAFGDLSENAEWTAAIEDQRLLTEKAQQIEEELRRARPLEDITPEDGIAAPGTRVT